MTGNVLVKQFFARLSKMPRPPSGELAGYLVKGVSGSFLVQGFGLVLGIASSVILARLLGASAYGTYSYVLAWLEILKIPLAYGLPIMVQREVAIYAGRGDWGLVRGLFVRANQFILLASALILVIAVTSTLFGIHALFRNPTERMTLYVALASLPVAGYSAARAAALNGMRRVVQAALPDQIVRPCVTVAVVLLLWLAGSQLTAPLAMVAQVTGVATAFALGIVLLLRALPPGFARLASTYDTQVWLRGLGPFLLHGASYVVWASLATVMLGWYCSPADVGIYRAAALAAGLSIFPITAFVATVSPLIARLHAEGDTARIQTVVSATTLAMFAFGFAGMGIYALAGGWMLRFVFGPEFGLGYGALVILAAGNWAFSGIWSVGVLLDMSGNQRFPAIGYLVALALNLLLGVTLIPRLGIEGAAIATAASWSLAHAGLAIVVRRRIGIRPDILHAMLWAIGRKARLSR